MNVQTNHVGQSLLQTEVGSGAGIAVFQVEQGVMGTPEEKTMYYDSDDTDHVAVKGYN